MQHVPLSSGSSVVVCAAGIMWSSFTLRRSKKEVDTGGGGDKVKDTVNTKLARAATFCFDSDYKEKKTKAKWLKNLPNVKKKMIKNKSERYKFEDYKAVQDIKENNHISVHNRFVKN